MTRSRIEINDRQSDVALDAGRLVRAGTFFLTRLGLRGSVSVALLTGEETARVNGRFFGRTEVTDVMAFPLGAGSHPGDDVVGEVLLCPSRAREQAPPGETAEDELLRLLAHGILHLAGRTDETEDTRAAMLEEGEKLLREFCEEMR
jgi:probable rRNA maturation factor